MAERSMKAGFRHEPVMAREAVDTLAVFPGGVYVDCTLGGGGHSGAILERMNGQGLLVGLDQDPAALEAAVQNLSAFAGCTRFVRANFSDLGQVLERLEITGVNGILFDLGVSSPQLDRGERGFSYQTEGPLDMRMDPRTELTAEELVNNLPESELTRVIRDYGEERWARRIASFIVAERERVRISTTAQLAEIIKRAIPAAARREGPHPARRTFQGLRIAVNDELGVLQKALDGAVKALLPGGRVVVISYHSLEDRIVKQTFRDYARTCVCPPGIPECRCGWQPLLKVLTSRPLTPGAGEIANNPRARSAKLRAAARVLKVDEGE